MDSPPIPVMGTMVFRLRTLHRIDESRTYIGGGAQDGEAHEACSYEPRLTWILAINCCFRLLAITISFTELHGAVRSPSSATNK